MATNKTIVAPTARDEKILELLLPDKKLDDQELHKNDTLNLFGIEIDLDSAKINIAGIFLWIIIWYKLKLFQRIEEDKTLLVIFIGFIIHNISQILNSSLYSASSSGEMVNLINIEQMGAVIFGSFALFSLFILSSYFTFENKKIINIILLTCLAIGCFQLVFFSTERTGKNFRKLRKVKENLFNTMIVLFLVALLFIHKSVSNSNE
jgi:hypothetical protein